MVWSMIRWSARPRSAIRMRPTASRQTARFRLPSHNWRRYHADAHGGELAVHRLPEHHVFHDLLLADAERARLLGADAVLTAFLGDGLRQTDEAMLGGDVGGFQHRSRSLCRHAAPRERVRGVPENQRSAPKASAAWRALCSLRVAVCAPTTPTRTCFGVIAQLSKKGRHVSESRQPERKGRLAHLTWRHRRNESLAILLETEANTQSVGIERAFAGLGTTDLRVMIPAGFEKPLTVEVVIRAEAEQGAVGVIGGPRAVDMRARVADLAVGREAVLERQDADCGDRACAGVVGRREVAEACIARLRGEIAVEPVPTVDAEERVLIVGEPARPGAAHANIDAGVPAARVARLRVGEACAERKRESGCDCCLVHDPFPVKWIDVGASRARRTKSFHIPSAEDCSASSGSTGSTYHAPAAISCSRS